MCNPVVIPKPSIMQVNSITFKRLIQILRKMCTKKTPIIPIAIKDSKISQNIYSDKVFVEINLPYADTNPISVNFILAREKLKELSDLGDSDVRIEVNDGVVSFINDHRSVELDHCQPELLPVPNLTKEMALGVGVTVKPPRELKKYLGKSKVVHFLVYNDQLEAIKTLDKAAYLFTSANRPLLNKQPDRLFSTTFFPVLLDGKGVEINLYQRGPETWVVCSHSDKFDFHVKTYMLVEE